MNQDWRRANLDREEARNSNRRFCNALKGD